MFGTLKIDVDAEFRPKDKRASPVHRERKVSEFLHNGYRVDLLDKGNKCTFTMVVAGASVSLLC